VANARRFKAQWIIQNVLMGLHVPGGRFNLQTVERSSMRMLSDTRRYATFSTQGMSAIGGTNFTQVTTPNFGTYGIDYTVSPAPVANTGRAGKFMIVPNLGLNRRLMIRYGLADGNLTDGIEAVIMLAGGGQGEAIGMTNTSFFGMRIIHGTTLISGHQVPFIRFAVKGSGASEILSPKIYHSTATATAPWAGGTFRVGTSNQYWVEYIGNGTALAKRFRAWHQPTASGSSETRLAQRRLIADWTSADITAGGSADESAYFGLVTNSSPSTPGGARRCTLEFFEIDLAPRYETDFAQQDLNY
jgi:hypothetical protein